MLENVPYLTVQLQSLSNKKKMWLEGGSIGIFLNVDARASVMFF